MNIRHPYSIWKKNPWQLRKIIYATKMMKKLISSVLFYPSSSCVQVKNFCHWQDHILRTWFFKERFLAFLLAFTLETMQRSRTIGGNFAISNHVWLVGNQKNRDTFLVTSSDILHTEFGKLERCLVWDWEHDNTGICFSLFWRSLHKKTTLFFQHV